MIFSFRTLVSLLLIIALSDITHAQSFLPAKLITSKGDTLSGYVRADYDQSFVRFRNSWTTKPINYDIPALNGLVTMGMAYERKVLDGKNILMQKLVSGPASLFVLRRKQFRKDRFFLEKGTDFVELIHESSEKMARGRRYIETYQNHLAVFTKLLGDCNEFTNQPWPTGFTEKAFVMLVSAYNQCIQRENPSLFKNTLYSANKLLPVRWFINVGAGLLGAPSGNVKSSLDHYQWKMGVAGGHAGYVSLDDKGSRALTNRLFTTSFGFEQGQCGNAATWGFLASYSTIMYKHSIQSQGTYTYDPNPYLFTNSSGDVHELAPPLENQPLVFEGQAEEKASVIQADFFLRHYWTLDHSRLYLGTGIGYGIISSSFWAPVKVYFANAGYQGIAVQNSEPVTAARSGLDFLVQAGWSHFIYNGGKSIGLSIQYNSLQSHRLSLSLNYSF
ncbi:hypothetical protein [Spirosoma sp. KNUC1025]|uniref:hypothetical protein n=1 Tax=Spirosoma sp. KNUC1025 TaxID=2894082 RepID=UPI003867F9EB|nr:hypothetical protein LN737_11890 [Spirosoma sp. KNUC1025]